MTQSRDVASQHGRDNAERSEPHVLHSTETVIHRYERPQKLHHIAFYQIRPRLRVTGDALQQRDGIAYSHCIRIREISDVAPDVAEGRVNSHDLLQDAGHGAERMPHERAELGIIRTSFAQLIQRVLSGTGIAEVVQPATDFLFVFGLH